MKKIIFTISLLIMFFPCFGQSPWVNHGLEMIPTAYKGRFRPCESVAKLWLFEFYHAESLKSSDLAAFHSDSHSALELMWKMHFLGVDHYKAAPLFWIHYSDIKKSLQLDLKRDRFSYNELYESLNENSDKNISFVKTIILSEYFKAYHNIINRSLTPKLELKSLALGLWIDCKNGQLIVLSAPSHFPWHFLKPGTVISTNISLEDFFPQKKALAEESLKLLYSLKNFEQSQSESPLIMLPSKKQPGKWLPLHMLKSKENFTNLPDPIYQKIKSHYLTLEKAALAFDKEIIAQSSNQLSCTLEEVYNSFEGKVYAKASDKELIYPSKWQLKMEAFLYHYPLISITIALYIFALTFFLFRLKRTALTTLIIAFTLHTLILVIRCFILQRPPVSSMFETILYVPWVTVVISLFLRMILKQTLPLVASSLASVILLILLELTQLDNHMENVQAVLDSQYWLIVHVLMVVGSYGAFILGGILGHIYLFQAALGNPNTLNSIGRAILQSLYLGTALLIPGTILGGVWAAESWGRFWDWDPKESWAFISSCTYLICIHLYTFKKIDFFGLALGSILGLIVISFTWYGVNYILGTGLHSYGFGSGGSEFYLLFLIIEIGLLAFASIRVKRKLRLN